jgi:hypothetical protein
MSLKLRGSQDCRGDTYSGCKSRQGIFWRCWHVASRCRMERLFVLSSHSIMSTPLPPRAQAIDMIFISIPDSTDRGCLYGTGTRSTQTPIHTVHSTRTQTSDASRTPFLPHFPFHRFSIVQTFHHGSESRTMDRLIMYSILYHTHIHTHIGLQYKSDELLRGYTVQALSGLDPKWLGPKEGTKNYQINQSRSTGFTILQYTNLLDHPDHHKEVKHSVSTLVVRVSPLFSPLDRVKSQRSVARQRQRTKAQ